MGRSIDSGRSDAEDTKFVYDWRLQQEAALRASKGVGMTDKQVINFVNGCKCHQDRKSQAIAEFSPRAGHNPSIPMSNLISISASGISDLLAAWLTFI